MDTELKSSLDGILNTVTAFKTAQEQQQKQLDALDLLIQNNRHVGGGETDSLSLAVKAIEENAGFAQLKQTGRGRAIIETKLFDTERKTVTSGSIIPYLPVGGIGDSGRQLFGGVRRLMRSLPIEVGSAFFVKETAFDNQASPVAEASSKNESNFTFVSATANVGTIAHWCRISKAAADDSAELSEFIRNSLLFGLERRVEYQLLSGDGVSPNLPGLLGTATNFNSSLLNLIAADGWNFADCLRAAILQLAEAGYGCTGFVVSPRDWFVIETMKSSTHEYIVGDPRGRLDEILWSLPIVASPAMANGTFLAGDFDTGAHIRMRQQGTIDISDSDADNFTKNLLTVRGEQRAALIVSKPGAFCTGNFESSPA